MKSIHSTQSIPHILIIEHDPYYIQEVDEAIKEKATKRSFETPNIFQDRVTLEDIEKANLILIDYKYPQTNAIECGIVHYIKNTLKYKGKVVLFSQHRSFPKACTTLIEKSFDGFISKSRIDWEAISAHL